jgi:hypothetical protein
MATMNEYIELEQRAPLHPRPGGGGAYPEAASALPRCGLPPDRRLDAAPLAPPSGTMDLAAPALGLNSSCAERLARRVFRGGSPRSYWKATASKLSGAPL